MKKKKKSRLPLIIFIFLVIVGIAFLFPLVAEYTDTTSEYDEAVTITIPQGASSDAIGEILKENDIIRSVNVFKLKAKLSPEGSRMNYGTFTLYKGMCIDDIIKTLSGTYTYRETVRFTVPEGFSVQQIAARAEDLGICSKSEFLAALTDDYDYSFLKGIDFSGEDYPLQGFLYPETYEFFADSKPHDIIDKMLSQFEKATKDIKLPAGDKLHEVIVVASLLEREALLSAEMPTIAGVIYNRIDQGMRLQVDACVQYAVSEGDYNLDRILYRHLEIDSPYNTYKITGLPIGAICNPSATAVKAALNPEKHDYLYYHTDTEKNDGSHIFTKTYREHIATQ